MAGSMRPTVERASGCTSRALEKWGQTEVECGPSHFSHLKMLVAPPLAALPAAGRHAAGAPEAAVMAGAAAKDAADGPL